MLLALMFFWLALGPEQGTALRTLARASFLLAGVSFVLTQYAERRRG